MTLGLNDILDILKEISKCGQWFSETFRNDKYLLRYYENQQKVFVFCQSEITLCATKMLIFDGRNAKYGETAIFLHVGWALGTKGTAVKPLCFVQRVQ